MAKNRPRRGSPLHLSGAFELFGQSYQVIKRNLDVFLVLFSIGALLALWDALGRYVGDEPERDWTGMLLNRGFGGTVDVGIFAAGGFMLIFSILYILAFMLLMIAVLRAAQGQKISLMGIWRELVDRWLWVKLIATFILIVLSLIVGFLLLIIPGVILLWRLFFVPYVLIDQKTTIEEAFRRSWRMTSGYAWAIYSIILVSLLLALTSIFPVIGPLIAFVLSSIYMAAPALRYQEIKNQTK